MIRTSPAKPDDLEIPAFLKRNKDVAPVVAQTIVDLPIETVRADGGTQSRALLQDTVIEDYAAAIGEGAAFPAIVIFYDGTDHWLADGFHRYQAHLKLGLAEIRAEVRQGTRRDAILYSVGANEAHGLRRTNDDKRRAVLTLLNDAEWVKWSDGEIAKRCGVSREYVNRLRPSVTCDQVTSERTYTTKHGTVATMNTGAIGKSVTETQEEENAVEQAAEIAAPTTRNAGAKFFVPEGENIVDLCRRGLAMEAEGEASDRVAAKLNLADHTYRACRQIVMLADNPDLSAKDHEIAERALAMLVETGQWGGAWEFVEPLAVKVWGEGKRPNLLSIAGKRLDQFETAFGILMQTCLTTDEIELPYLTSERAKKAMQQIGKARGALDRFAKRIKEIHE